MSKLIIDSVIEYANDKKVPIMLIASRRQIDSLTLGGGYVEGWDSKKFADYVHQKDKGKFIFICRDHGGPWQNDVERNYDVRKAIYSAKKSFKEDINSDFDLIHIDSSIDLYSEIDFSKVLQRLFILYKYCCEYSRRKNKDIEFEIGTEEQTDKLNTKETNNLLKIIIDFCTDKEYKTPFFVVAQIGTLVKELENLGEIKKANYPIENLRMAVELCERYNVRMKAHNCDYLDNLSLSKIKEAGVHSMNIGPEFGTLHTKEILNILAKKRLHKERDSFIRMAVNSNKWKKWLIHKDREISDIKKTIISGHYVFSKPEFKFLYKRIMLKLKEKNVNINKEIKRKIKYHLDIKCNAIGYFD